MPDIKEHIEYLSQEVGPRPAGTEEEQKASLYIADQLQNEAGLTAKVEDFGGVGDPEMVSLICGAVAVLFALLALLVPGLGLVWFIGALVGAGLFAAEIMGKPVLSRFLGKGVSQNVVAKYEPGSESNGSARKRKVIVIARYDSGKVRKELSAPFVSFLPIVTKASTVAIVAMPILLLLKCVLLGSVGVLAGFFTLLIVVALVLAAVPVALAVLHRAADYNEGANNNAAGVASMLEVARRVGAGRMSEAELAEREDAIMHGEDAARENGLVPEGAEFVYSDSSAGSSEGLNAAKAAIAALSGKPVSGMTEEEVARNLEMIDEQAKSAAAAKEAASRPLAPRQEDAGLEYVDAAEPIEEDAVEPAEDSAYEEVSSEFTEQSESAAEPVQMPVRDSSPATSVPDWFRKAQEKAKKSKKTDKPAQRSRYASALDAADAEGSGQFAQAASAAAREVEAASQAERSAQAPVYEVHAPKWGVIDPVEPAVPVEPEVQEQSETVESEPLGADAPIVATDAAATSFEAYADEPASDPEAVATPGFDTPEAANEPVIDETVTDAAANVNFGSDSENVAERVAPDSEHMTPSAAAIPQRSVVPVSADPSATVATPPIDVSMLNIEGANIEPSIPVPSFMDPLKVQAEKKANQPVSPRSLNRVDATDAEITNTGVVDQNTLIAEVPFAAPSDNAAAPVQADGQETSGESSQVPGAASAASPTPKKRHTRRPILLPDLPGSDDKAAPVISQAKQRAPLADVESSGKTAAKSLLRTLPTIGSADVLGAEASQGESSDGETKPASGRAKNASLLVSLPSLSGAIKAADSAQEQAKTAAQLSSGTAGASGAFAPVTDELIREASLEDETDGLYVDDVDDSEYDTDFTQTGAIAGPGYVEMPKSRFRRFLDRFHRDKDDIDETPQEWLDVDDEFEARSVGKARGGWESFQNEAYDGYDDGYAEEAYGDESAVDQQEYNDYDQNAIEVGYAAAGDASGAGNDASCGNATQAFPPYGQIDADVNDSAYASQPFAGQSAQSDYFDDGFDADDVYDDQPKRKRFRPWHGGAFSPRRMEDGNLDSEEVSAAMEASLEDQGPVDAELEQIYKFRNPDINTEVWFVALGSEMAGNAGMQAFMAEHERDLKGAFIVQLDALGAGELTLIDGEGCLKPAKPSSRMKRYLRKASQASGVKLASAPLLWEESAASYATKHGLQAVHLVGMEGGKPVGYGEPGDVAENVDDKTLSKNVKFVMELLKNF